MLRILLQEDLVNKQTDTVGLKWVSRLFKGSKKDKRYSSFKGLQAQLRGGQPTLHDAQDRQYQAISFVAAAL